MFILPFLDSDLGDFLNPLAFNFILQVLDRYWKSKVFRSKGFNNAHNQTIPTLILLTLAKRNSTKVRVILYSKILNRKKYFTNRVSWHFFNILMNVITSINWVLSDPLFNSLEKEPEVNTSTSQLMFCNIGGTTANKVKCRSAFEGFPLIFFGIFKLVSQFIKFLFICLGFKWTDSKVRIYNANDYNDCTYEKTYPCPPFHSFQLFFHQRRL